MVLLLIYVDDMLITCKSKERISQLKKNLSSEFDMTDLGRVRRILGMDIFKDKKMNRLKISQQSYLENLIAKFEMKDAKPAKVPIGTHFQISAKLCPEIEEERSYMEKVHYSNVVGSIMYSMVSTRSDISYVISFLNRYMGNPGNGHWIVMKWLIRYLIGTLKISLIYEKAGSKVWLDGYVDLDHDGDKDKKKKSVHSFILLYFEWLLHKLEVTT